MLSYNSTLSNVLNIDKWQQVQDSLALVTQMALITIDYTGTPVTAHSGCSDFCSYVRSDSELSKLCYKCDARGGLEAVRAHEPYIYHCHFGIIDIAIPIIVEDRYIGAVMAGQVRLADSKYGKDLEQMLVPKERRLLDSTLATHLYQYESLPKLSMNRIRFVSDMLFHLCNYIVSEAMDNNARIKTCMDMMSGDATRNDLLSADGLDILHLDLMKKDISNSLLDVLIKEQNEHIASSTPPLLQSAFDYIHTHKSEAIKLEDVAKVCHISPSYFSRMFKKETGITFKAYVSQLKINWAKELLMTTNFSVNKISETLGFSDAGYLIKQFRKIYGVTPNTYRNSRNM